MNTPRSSTSQRLAAFEIGVMTSVVVALVCAAAFNWWSIGWVETLGFITGGVCVWLVVREHIWNWPIGLANNLVFLVLFWKSALYADAGLQIVYFVMGAYGWWNWLYGGGQHSALTITRTPLRDWLLLFVAVPVLVWLLRAILIAVHGAAPFWDATTTVLSLAAQYWMCRKYLEHWVLWIIVDIIYIPLYFSRDLPLTAVLYGVFLVMCLVGWREWWKNWKQSRDYEQVVSASGGDRQVLSSASRA